MLENWVFNYIMWNDYTLTMCKCTHSTLTLLHLPSYLQTVSPFNIACFISQSLQFTLWINIFRRGKSMLLQLCESEISIVSNWKKKYFLSSFSFFKKIMFSCRYFLKVHIHYDKEKHFKQIFIHQIK